MLKRVVTTCALLIALLAGAGCSSMTPGDLEAVRPDSDAPRAGNVYLFRGWIGIFSTGIDSLTDKVNAAGVRAMVFQQTQWRELAQTIATKYKSANNAEPIVLIGHSYGADDVVSLARELDSHNIKVDLIITLDPTTPPLVPKNVVHVVNLYQPNILDVMPFLRGIPLEAEKDFKGKLENINIREERRDLMEDDVNHFNIEKKEAIHQETIKRVLVVCPPRAQWTATRRGNVFTGLAPFKPTYKPADSKIPTASTNDRMNLSVP